MLGDRGASREDEKPPKLSPSGSVVTGTGFPHPPHSGRSAVCSDGSAFMARLPPGEAPGERCMVGCRAQFLPCRFGSPRGQFLPVVSMPLRSFPSSKFGDMGRHRHGGDSLLRLTSKRRFPSSFFLKCMAFKALNDGDERVLWRPFRFFLPEGGRWNGALVPDVWAVFINFSVAVEAQAAPPNTSSRCPGP